jgi:O-antigen/teichoic acid export membrane protein
MLFKKIAIITSTDFVLKGLSFLVLPIYLGWMSKADFGEYGYISTGLALMPPIISIGLYINQIKEEASTARKNMRGDIFSSTFLFILIYVSFFLILVSFFNLDFFVMDQVFGVTYGIKEKSLVFDVLVLVMTLNLIIYASLVSSDSNTNIAKYNCIKFLVQNCILLLVIHIGILYIDTSYTRLLCLLFGEIIILMLTSAIFCRKLYSFRIDWSYIKRALLVGAPVVPGSIATIFLSLSDRYFLKHAFSLEYVAEYNLAVQFLLPAQTLMVAAQVSWASHVYGLESNHRARHETWIFIKKLLKIYLLVVPSLFAIAVLGLYFSVIPSVYKNLPFLIIILSIPTIGIALLQLPFNLFIRVENSISITYIMIWAASISIALGSFLIPEFGFYGVAITGLLVSISSLGLSFFRIRHLYRSV